jgi:two-component system, NarL family, sensor histidine kinase UhpB
VRAGEDERRTIARELHDEIGQALMAVKMDLARAAAECPDPPQELGSARQGVDGAIENVRSLSRMLHPMVLEDLGLAAALDWHVRAFGKRSGLEVNFSHVGLQMRLPSSVEACIYRAVQEATNNVARHAGATRCSVTVEHSSGRVTAVVADNGCGIQTVEAAEPRGLGLIGIRERVEGFGGSMDINGSAGQGTRLRVDVPVREGDVCVEAPVRLAVANGSTTVALSN